jgi:hypothetical protein
MSHQQALPLDDLGVTTTDIKLDASGRARRMFRFWLDAAKPEEAALGVKLEELGKKRKFATLIRDAIRLMLALMAGDLSVLVELFPNVVEQIKAEARAEAIQSEATAQFMAFITQAAEAAASKTAAAIESKRESVMVEAERLPAPVSSGGLQPLGGLKPIAAAPLAPPSFDDDDDFSLTVSKADNAGSNAAQNLINSLMALQGKKST